MARLGYLAVLIVVLGSVGFGLDWQSAPMSPMPESGRAAQAVPATSPAPIGQAAPPAPPIACNVSACARAYRSFQAADCSYQPSGGPRRRCTK